MHSLDESVFDSGAMQSAKENANCLNKTAKPGDLGWGLQLSPESEGEQLLVITHLDSELLRK